MHSSVEMVGAATSALAEALRPVVRATDPGEGRTWADEYRRHGHVVDGADPLDDVVFLLRVVGENTRRFPGNPATVARTVATARQRVAKALADPTAVDPHRLAQAAVAVLAALDMAAPPALTTLAEADPSSDPSDRPEASADDVPAALRRWQGDLLDLSRRNRLISLGDHGISFLVEEADLAAIEDVVADGSDLVVRGWDDLDDISDTDWGDTLSAITGPADLTPEFRASMLATEGMAFTDLETGQMRTRLSNLRRRAQVAAAESGASPLYLTVGALRMGGDLAPLFLVPVQIEGPRMGPWSVHLQPGTEPRLNECLVEFLRRKNAFVPGVLMHPPRDQAGIDIPRVFVELRRTLEARRFPYAVVADMRLVLVQFSSMHMWRDLRDHGPEFMKNPLVHHLVEGGETFTDPVPEPCRSTADEYDLSLPIAADGSQMQAVRWAHDGRTFVLQGPPGTGKSQTIANIVADAVASGRTVLFVAEKDAALEVVKRRLTTIGLSDRCLDLRDKDLTTLAVRTHLKRTVIHEGVEVSVLDVDRERHRHHVEHLAEPVCTRSADGDVRAQEVAAYRESAARLRGSLRRVIGGLGLPRASTWRGEDEMSSLRRELRVARAESVRDLIASHPEQILTLTPCVLASPTAVARHLPARAGLFDLVVFDEASQIRVESAIGAMGRGRSVVIVGDPQQMPPTSAFGGEAADEDASEQEESILLEATRAGLESLRLSWHYRSRSEGLVAFSNARYYDSRLASFPTPPTGRAAGAVEFRRVPGRYEAGRRGRDMANRLEAQHVVAEVTRLLEADADTSVGVVTFNIAQRDVILDALEERSPEVVRQALARESEPLIVKSLEHIQGDERDHILFSLTYSVDEKGHLPSNFGLLSWPGGERRLNVAITRARVRNVVFASFDPTDITAGKSSAGPAHLREYLLSARHGHQVTATRAGLPDATRTALATRLRSAGVTVAEDVGMSAFKVDLAVRRGEGPWLAVLLDTDEWCSRATVADRDDIPYTVLGDYMGWAGVHQVLREEWERSPDVVVQRVLRHVGGLADEGRPVLSTVEASVGGGVEAAEVADAVARSVQQQEAAARQVTEAVGVGGLVLTPFRPCEEDVVGAKSVVESLPSRAAAAQVAAQWREVVAAEGPILVRRGATIIAHRFDVRRLHATKRIAIERCIPADLPRTRVGDEELVWPVGVDPEHYQGLRPSSRPHRKIHEVAPEEIANAVRYVLADSGGRCDGSLLVRGVSELFGFGRVGHLIEAGIVGVIETRVRAGELERQGHDIVSVTRKVSPPTVPARPAPGSDDESTSLRTVPPILRNSAGRVDGRY